MKKKKGSEIYMQFKQVLLSDYIQPLLNASNTVNETRSYALMALSQFPAGDIQTVLPEKSGDYLDEVLEINNPNYVPVLAKLMTHELDHMRRGLFKQEGQSKVTEDVVKTTLGEREHEMGHQLVELWESARVAPGLRSGYANAVLHTNEMKREPGVQDISKTKWYRSMVTCFTDIALTDHLLVRVSSLGGWKAFFNSVFLGDNQDVETKMDNLLNDLISRLERSTVPGTTCNILLAITGMCVYRSINVCV